MKNKALFWDRDGVVNELVKRDGGYYSPRVFSEFKLYDSVKAVISHSMSMGYLNIIVSNQPDISREKMLDTELEKMTNYIFSNFTFNDIFYCKHADRDNCSCRKPLSGLFLNAQLKWEINFSKSILIGDSWKDIFAAENVGVNPVLLRTEYNKKFKFRNVIYSLDEILTFLKN